MKTEICGLYFTLLTLTRADTNLYRQSRHIIEHQSGRPFNVYWNIPSWNCPKLGIDLELEKYGILHNDKQSWNGSVINIFYSLVNGHWPYYKDTKAINGGIPQLGNITKHLEIFRANVKTMIVNPNFDGLAVIDWEQW